MCLARCPVDTCHVSVRMSVCVETAQACTVRDWFVWAIVLVCMGVLVCSSAQGKANGAPSAKAGPSSRLAPAANGHPRNNTHKKAQPADVTHNNTQPRGNTHSTAGASVQKQAQSPSTPGSAQGPSAQGPSVGSPSSAQKRVRDTDEEGFLVPSPKRPVVQSQVRHLYCLCSVDWHCVGSATQ